MKQLILINPGKAVTNNFTNGLSLTGPRIVRTRKLAKIIATLIGNDEVIIFSSMEGNAEECSNILSRETGVTYGNIDCSQEDSTDTIKNILTLISRYSINADTLILVINCPFLIKLLQQVIRLYHNIDTDIDEIPDNCALFVDFESGPPCLVSPDDDVYAEN